MNLAEPVHVAAVQVTARLGDISWNIEHVEKLAREAAETGAKIVALPEFFTTSIMYDERLFSCSLPPDNPAIDMLMS
ncbi:MAG: carbon-nitrogen hydrolase family protein, partial [Candidatus Hydrogenedentes bacterium]|nr:carbon-nitrogen hydrolase family protein [Candidatus Hydrogenedentota bacterium]